MIKSLFVFLITCVMMAQLFSGSLILCRFYFNQKAIASEKCINKNKPRLKCNGKCYLAKQLLEETSKGKKYPEFPSFRKYPELNQKLNSGFPELHGYIIGTTGFFYQWQIENRFSPPFPPPPELS